MKNDIDKLRRKFGSLNAVAVHLEITERHLFRIYHGECLPSPALAYRIRSEAAKVLDEEDK